LPRLTRFAGAREERLRAAALRIRNRMNRLRLSESELARRLSLLPGMGGDAPSRDRLAKLLMNCKKSPEKSAAKLITAAELRAIADVLEVSFEWLVGQHPPYDPIYWDLLADPRRAGHVLHLLSEYEDSEESPGERLVWADHLRPALSTPEFTRAYCRSLVEDLPFAWSAAEKRAAAEMLSGVGKARRQRAVSLGRGRPYQQMIFLSDLLRLAEGRDEYARLPKALREECLRELASLVTEHHPHVALCVVSDEGDSRLARALGGYRAVGVFGNAFTLWSYRSCAVAWSEHRRHVSAHRRLLREARARAVTRNQQDAASLLLDLAARAR
jgi:transcriptional regulator with XRE-family HTH domain